jgi:DNA-directed RNA polymerase II subunit RPB2
MQELVDENSDLILHQAPQHTGHDEALSRRYEIKFGQIYLSRPTVTEADGSVVPVFPQEARLRNLTYSAPLYIEMKKRVFISRDEGEGDEATWDEETHESTDEESTKVWIGKVRIALRLRLHVLTASTRSQSCCGQPSVSSEILKTVTCSI